ncbi:hopanoid-associated sugar epimerase [Burkholderia oklahomensis]|uniref:3-beta hydroxysteroid dehydrogenase/isomerase family protein n=1 Tax=Burkholderia oklahomensis TaxID=342113 RepID=A0AAI8FQG5_9BURK|nr:hopanoid-associated sugar epimerase [Burkholderia oklahomensis]AIO69661.1 3-beta hydroxysteroid dehydrogenase/isomerase family protein [Burkholderia oklahomensis]AOI40288.1 NAD-dependent dehydratase [Burkholderia oklahomensis EO147]KUY65186.1 NAD-dependent dehydratase [Burkholderia oklahomensis EO147]QPS39346.1 NAD-dependent epimerase/dehydratase family protein [Burkholderia oklahomensis]
MTDIQRDLVLVTGASGFVGSAVARAARQQGYRVRVLVRPTSPRTNVADLDAEIATGDMRDEASMRAALRGVRYLLHVAADYRLWAPDPLEIERANLEGAVATMRAALAEGVERIVYTSSVATLKVTPSGASADESSPLAAEQAIGVYKRSKVLAERAVERMIADDKLPAVIVNPSTPIGPRDVKPTPTGRIIVEAALGKIPAFVDTGLNLVHVDDVALGHLLALERGQIGERYILGGENLPLQTMLADIAQLTGRKAPTLALPRWPLYPIALGAEAVAKVTKREPFVTVDGLRMSKNKMYFTSAKAERELGYRARPYREGIRDALDWFRQAGYLR